MAMAYSSINCTPNCTVNTTILQLTWSPAKAGSAAISMDLKHDNITITAMQILRTFSPCSLPVDVRSSIPHYGYTWCAALGAGSVKVQLIFSFISRNRPTEYPKLQTIGQSLINYIKYWTFDLYFALMKAVTMMFVYFSQKFCKQILQPLGPTTLEILMIQFIYACISELGVTNCLGIAICKTIIYGRINGKDKRCPLIHTLWQDYC